MQPTDRPTETTTAPETIHTFNPAEPPHLAAFAAEMAARLAIPTAPIDHPGGFPAVWADGPPHSGEWVCVGFPTERTWRAFGYLAGRRFERDGRFGGVGPAALAWVIARIARMETTPPATS